MAMKAAYYYALCAEPLILGSTGAVPRDGRIQRPELSASAHPYSLLQHFSWVIADSDAMSAVAEAQQRAADRGVDFHAMVSSAEEDALRRRLHVRGSHVGHNIHVDERVFCPTSAEKIHDAIYVAQLEKFKRLELAREIPRLKVISYGGDLHAFCPALQHADFNTSWVQPKEVALAVNGSYAGLCLSAEEGQMNASIEYLMCGVPVVNTPSRGGREEYFDAVNSLTVEPEAAAVREAVNHWKETPPDAELIRRSAVSRVNALRQSYCEYVSSLISSRGGPPVSADWLLTLYYVARKGMQGRAIHPTRVGVQGLSSVYEIEMPHHVPTRDRQARARDSDGGMMLGNARGDLVECNDSSALIWELCDGRLSIAEIIETLSAAFSVAADEMRGDVLDCIRLFSTAGLLHGR